ncbi:MAG: starch-binding protein [Ruminococcus sp.]|nr:starch-binding protein [Ruminococcus sp.]
MKRKFERVTSALLAAIMIGSVSAIPMTANAAVIEPRISSARDILEVPDATKPVSENILYFENKDNWANVYAYYWDTSDQSMTQWPGTQMTKVNGNIYSVSVSEKATMIIFNNGSGSQTKDIKIDGYNKVFSGDAWKNYEAPTEPTTAEPTTEVPTTVVPTVETTVAPTTEPVSVNYIYYKNTSNWSDIYAYYWNEKDTTLTKWPGDKMTAVENNIYSIEVPASAENVIFNNGNGAQTKDVKITSFNMLYDGSNWVEYTKPTEPTTAEPTTVEPTTVEPTTEPVTVAPTTAFTGKVLIGDATLNEKINVGDVTAIQSYIAELSEFSAAQMVAADTDEDNYVNVKDATNVQKYLLDLPNSGLVGKYKEEVPTTVEPTTEPETIVAPTTAEATTVAPTTEPVTVNYVYYKNTANWSKVYAYYWNDKDATLAVWPGVEMTLVNGDVYSVEVPEKAEKIIFNNGDKAQTADITISAFNKLYDGKSWVDYEVPTEPTTVEPTEAPTTEPAAENYVYYKNTANWSKVYAYYWNDKKATLTVWPGVEMTLVNGDIYSVKVPSEAEKIIFNNGDKSQTADLTIPAFGKLYDGKSWVDYEVPTEPTTVAPTTVEPTEAPTTEPTTEPVKDTTVYYYQNANNWSEIYAYFWNENDTTLTQWPGVKMTAVENNIFSVEVPKTADTIIFNDGKTNKTSDISLPKESKLYSGEQWVDYTTGKVVTGECGDKAVWSLNLETGVMTISGTGITYGYGKVWGQPWRYYANDIKKVVFEEGITNIGRLAFASTSVAEVVISSTVTEIDTYAFSDCENLKEITIPATVTSMGTDVFGDIRTKKIVINCKAGSTAHQYAINSKFDYKLMNNTVKFVNTQNWEKVYAYYWSKLDEKMVEWPGVEMKNTEDNVYELEIPGEAELIIFTNGTYQTQDLTIPVGGGVFDGSNWVA